MSIRIERDDIFNLRQDSRLTDDQRETGILRTDPEFLQHFGVCPQISQERIQIGELSALAFVTHPNAFLGIPSAWAMKQEEGLAFPFSVSFVQLFNSRLRQEEQRLIFSRGFPCRILKIG